MEKRGSIPSILKCLIYKGIILMLAFFPLLMYSILKITICDFSHILSLHVNSGFDLITHSRQLL